MGGVSELEDGGQMEIDKMASPSHNLPITFLCTAQAWWRGGFLAHSCYSI